MRNRAPISLSHSAFSIQHSSFKTGGINPPARSDSSFILHPSSFKTGGINPPARPGFTLTELLVSLVILVGMMTLVATIFSTAGKSSGTARAQTRLQRQLRQVIDTIRIDLANTLPGTETSGAPKGVLAIAGATVNAADTQKTAASSYPHRADVLMLLTQQRFEPFVYNNSSAQFEGCKQVVYGHADIGKLTPPPGVGWMGTVKHVENAKVEEWLASEWHLARRVVGFRKLDPFLPPTDTRLCWPPVSQYFLGTDPNGVMTDVVYDPTPLSTILSQTTPGYYNYRRDTTVNQINLVESFFSNADGVFLFDAYRPPSFFLFSNPYWWKFDGTAGTDLRWTRNDLASSPPRKDLLMPMAGLSKPFPSLFYTSYARGDRVDTFDPLPQPYYRFWPQWFCSDPAANSADLYRTRLDPMPPPGMPERTSAYFLPACAEFKVEFTYDDPREVAAFEGQPITSDITGNNTQRIPAPAPIRWQEVPPGYVYVWTGLATDPEPYGSGDPRNRTFPYRWPRALRITIRAYSPGGALDYPVEQSLIHVW